jgi:hypothetical protein
MKLCLDFVFGRERVLSCARRVSGIEGWSGRIRRLGDFALAPPQLVIGLGRQRTRVLEAGNPSDDPSIRRRLCKSDGCLN